MVSVTPRPRFILGRSPPLEEKFFASAGDRTPVFKPVVRHCTGYKLIVVCFCVFYKREPQLIYSMKVNLCMKILCFLDCYFKSIFQSYFNASHAAHIISRTKELACLVQICLKFYKIG
jgi:hypothetical protein